MFQIRSSTFSVGARIECASPITDGEYSARELGVKRVDGRGIAVNGVVGVVGMNEPDGRIEARGVPNANVSSWARRRRSSS